MQKRGAFIAGSASRSITPALPFALGGYGPAKRLRDDDPSDHRWYVGRAGEATEVHDESFARVLALSRADTSVTLVSLDFCMVRSDLIEQIQQALHGVVETALIIGATHSHSSPSMTTTSERQLLVTAIADAVKEAHDAMAPARLGWARGRLDGPTVNRRDGARYRDPDVTILRVESLEGQAVGAVVNYTCHANVLGSANRAATADFPGYVSRLVEKALGDEAVCLFFNGAAGDINPCVHPYSRDRNIDDLERSMRRVGEEPRFRESHREAQRLGNLIGAEAIRASEGLRLDSSPEIGHIKRVVSVPLKADDDLEHFMDHMTMTASTRALYEGRDHLDVEFNSLRIGGGLISAISGEPFVDIGRRIKESFPGVLTTVFGYVNDWPGYIPYAPYFGENRYESVASPFSEVGCKLIELEAIRTTAELLEHESRHGDMPALHLER